MGLGRCFLWLACALIPVTSWAGEALVVEAVVVKGIAVEAVVVEGRGTENKVSGTAEFADRLVPPESLKKWYKPQNKRQVWLHTMFRLRQSMQAIDYYLDADNPEKLIKWAGILRSTYAKIPQMVPEWEAGSRQQIALELEQAAEKNDQPLVAKKRARLQKFCDACHQQWQPLVAALYRSPDYRTVKVEGTGDGRTLSYPELMQQLSAVLGVLKINREDGDLPKARAATQALRARLNELGRSCSSCHQDDIAKERILGAQIDREFDALTQALSEPHNPKESGKHLGMIGFKVCGRCHSIHRTLGDLRGWVEAAEN